MYKDFALVYDALNGDADYDKLFANIKTQLVENGVESGTILDAGCGTGELTLRLAADGYDMIGADISADMLSVLDEKARSKNVNVVLVNCDIAKIRLYSRVNAVVCTFDTLNHLTPVKLDATFKRIANALEDDGVFVFDMNTPYKHTHILADYAFEIQGDGVTCIWSNNYNKKLARTRLLIELYYDDGSYAYERFFEYAYTRKTVEMLCEQYGLKVKQVVDGETFGELRRASRRYCFTAIKTKRK